MILRATHLVGSLLLLVGLARCGDNGGQPLLADHPSAIHAVSRGNSFAVNMAWDESPARQPVGTSLSATASFFPAGDGEPQGQEVRDLQDSQKVLEHLDVQVVDVVCTMSCCGSRTGKTPQWEQGPQPNQVRIWDVRPDSSGWWRIKISARVNGAEAQDATIVIQTP